MLGEGYPELAVIYAAVIGAALDAREYYAPGSAFRHRPDCIYRFHRLNGTIEHSGRTPLHADPAYRSRDIGAYPFYRNGRTLVSLDFRYFGQEAVAIPARLERLREVAETLGQGHRVFGTGEPVERELEMLFRMLWKLPTRHTPSVVTSEARGHAPRLPKPAQGGRGGETGPGNVSRSRLGKALREERSGERER